ncbi:MAG: S1 RNA-binding domain-containing protein [Planctomycetes bacterium]|nr:S1 RNA-binding domain-containing protein [Planctomycetota bacterium]
MVRRLEADDVGPWVRDVLLAPGRRKPVVAVTTQPFSDRTWIDPAALEAQVGDLADVAVLATGEPTWALAEALPPRLDAYGGALRIWWPGLGAHSDPYDHRLYFVHSPEGATRVLREVVAAVRRHAGVAPAAAPARLARAPAPAPAPAAWKRIVAELAVGDVVRGRVQNVKEYGAFVDLLPGVTGLVHKSQIDWTYVDSVDEFVQPGELVAVKILSIEPEQRRMELSIKQAYGSDQRPLPALEPGGPPFAWTADAGSRPAGAAVPARPDGLRVLQDQLAGIKGECEELHDALEAAEDDRGRLRAKNQELRKDLRAAEDRAAALERRMNQDYPLASERAFLLGVRLAYARLFDEGARQERPLQRMRVGPAFLDSLRALEGIAIDKVLEVCAHVAAGTAHELAAREVHQLRAGPRGAAARVRAADGAQAWRCALQVNTPSARRLHWWNVPGPGSATIEFANVVLHDDFSIPE